MGTPREQLRIDYGQPYERLRPRRDYYEDVVPTRLFHAYPVDYRKEIAAGGMLAVLAGSYILDKYLANKKLREPNASAGVTGGASRQILTKSIHPQRSYGRARQAWRDVYKNLKHMGLSRTPDTEFEYRVDWVPAIRAYVPREFGQFRGRTKEWRHGNDVVRVRMVDRGNANGMMPIAMNIV